MKAIFVLLAFLVSAFAYGPNDDPILSDFEPKFQNISNRFNNWYFIGNFGFKGERMMIVLVLTESNLLFQNVRMSIINQEISLQDFTYFGQETQIINEPVGDTNIHYQWEDEPLFWSTDGTSVTIQQGFLTAVCNPDICTVVGSEGRVEVDLSFVPNGFPAMWYGGERGAVHKSTPRIRTQGYANAMYVSGTVTIDGDEAELDNELGSFERLFLDQLQSIEVRNSDRVVGFWDDAFLFFQVISGADLFTGLPVHSATGGVITKKPDESYARIEFDGDGDLFWNPQTFAFDEAARRWDDIETSFSGFGAAGTSFNLHISATHSPIYRTTPSLLFLPYAMHGIPAWWTTMVDYVCEAEGEVMIDGELYRLQNGVALSNSLRILHL